MKKILCRVGISNIREFYATPTNSYTIDVSSKLDFLYDDLFKLFTDMYMYNVATWAGMDIITDTQIILCKTL